MKVATIGLDIAKMFVRFMALMTKACQCFDLDEQASRPVKTAPEAYRGELYAAAEYGIVVPQRQSPCARFGRGCWRV